MVLNTFMCFFRKLSSATCFIIYCKICSQIGVIENNVTFKGREVIKIRKFVSFAEGVMTVSKVYEQRVLTLPFLALHFQAEFNLHRYLLQATVRIILDCMNVFLDRQYIVRQEDFQHKILNQSSLLPLLAPAYKFDRQEGVETMRIVYKFKSGRSEVLYKK